MRLPYIASFVLLAACSTPNPDGSGGGGAGGGGTGGSGGGSDNWPTFSGHRDPVVKTSMCPPANIIWGTPKKPIFKAAISRA